MSSFRRLVAAVLLLLVAFPFPANGATATRKAGALRVVGNRLVDAAGRTVQLRGVNRSSPETLCLGTGRDSFFYGPTDSASVNAIKSWSANAVRIPITEDCWLGRNGLPRSLTAEEYRRQIAAYTRLVLNAGLYVIIDVHFASTTLHGVEQPSWGPAPMLGAAHGVELWQSIVATFARDEGIVYDLYNEPHSINWACWRDGCTDPLTGSRYLGMQALVTAVRAAGAKNPLLVTGPSWGAEIGWWLAYQPVDPLKSLIAGVHIYDGHGCSALWCLEERVASVARSVPVVIGELGALDCAGLFLTALPAWADRYGISYLAFTWNVPRGMPCPSYHLITSFDGTPTPAGSVFRSHLRGVAGVRVKTLPKLGYSPLRRVTRR
ncbi:MAG TPA: cellulase family glycosylhydrolase [Frankiaceae bacterium]|nr:cellulase family glycosylhydrolase [Frankiaceae bacterium]